MLMSGGDGQTETGRQTDRQTGMKTLTERQPSAWTGDIIDTTARHRQTDTRKRQIAAQIERDWQREEKKKKRSEEAEREGGGSSKQGEREEAGDGKSTEKDACSHKMN